MKTFLISFVASSTLLHAGTGVLDVPSNRFASDTAYAEWDSFTGFLSGGDGTTVADATHQITTDQLQQANSAASPGGLLGSPGDQRVYSGPTTMDWGITATSSVSYNTATLRVVERLDFDFNDPDAPVVGLTEYTVDLNGQPPTTATAVPIIEIIEIPPFTFEIPQVITTFTWSLPISSTNVDINIVGEPGLHDSVDAFVLDLETIVQPTVPNLEVAVSGGQLTLSWPDSTNATLQYTDDLSDPASWIPSTETVMNSNNTNSVSLTLPATPTFYRLSN